MTSRSPCVASSYKTLELKFKQHSLEIINRYENLVNLLECSNVFSVCVCLWCFGGFRTPFGLATVGVFSSSFQPSQSPSPWQRSTSGLMTSASLGMKKCKRSFEYNLDVTTMSQLFCVILKNTSHRQGKQSPLESFIEQSAVCHAQ